LKTLQKAGRKMCNINSMRLHLLFPMLKIAALYLVSIKSY
jgi:hypothetical protein